MKEPSDRYKVSVPEGRCGVWRVERLVVTGGDEGWQKLRAILNPHRPARVVPAGTYTYLKRIGGTFGDETVMSDTPDEIRDLRPLFDRVDLFTDGGSGEGIAVLINGLGLGIALRGVLLEPAVRRVDVVEIDPDVIALVGPTYAHDARVHIIAADAFRWESPKGARWDVVWHDIWDSICGDNVKGMIRLHRKYGRRCRWQGSWCRELCERRR